MHESTQRRVCRVAFVIFCLVPTVLSVTWIAWFRRPWRENDWQRAISQQLHVRAKIEDILNPRPGVTRLLGVQLADLRNKNSLASLDSALLERRQGKLTLSAQLTEVRAKQLPLLTQSISTWLSSGNSSLVELCIDRLHIVGEQGNLWELRNVLISNSPSAAQPRMLRLFADTTSFDTETASLQLLLADSNTEKGSRIHATLDATRARIPAWVLGDLIPGVSSCPMASFTGLVRIQSDFSKLTGTLRGQLSEVDLQAWAESATPHRLEGTAHLELDNFSWQDGRVEVAQGNLRVRRGKVSHSLLTELAKRLFCVPGTGMRSANLSNEDQLQTFDELACGYSINNLGISLRGQCSSVAWKPTGCLLAFNGDELLSEPGYSNIPLAQLVQVFSMPSKSWLPATREAAELADSLPLPTTQGRIATRSDTASDSNLTR